jgi:hypothetical protein
MHSTVIGPFIRFGASPTVVFIATLGMSFVIQNGGGHQHLRRPPFVST